MIRYFVALTLKYTCVDPILINYSFKKAKNSSFPLTSLMWVTQNRIGTVKSPRETERWNWELRSGSEGREQRVPPTALGRTRNYSFGTSLFSKYIFLNECELKVKAATMFLTLHPSTKFKNKTKILNRKS